MQPVHGPTGLDCTDVLAGQVARRALIRRIFIKCLFTLYGGRHWLNQNLRSGHLELNQETIVAITKKQRHVHTRRWQSRANSVRHRVVPLHRATGAFAVLRTSNIGYWAYCPSCRPPSKREGQQHGNASCGLTAAFHMRSDSPRQLPATWLARRALVAVTIICSLSKPASAVTTARKAFYLPLTRRDGVSRARGLLRNASLPLHGAVRDYGCASAFGTAPTPLCHLAVPNQSHQLQRSAVKSHVRPRRGTSLVLSRAGVQRKAQAPGRLEHSVVCLLLTNDRSAVAGC